MNEAISPAGPKPIKIAIPTDGWHVQARENASIPSHGIVVNFDVDEERHAIDITSNRIAEHVFSDFGTADTIIFGDQIERRSIDPDTGADQR